MSSAVIPASSSRTPISDHDTIRIAPVFHDARLFDEARDPRICRLAGRRRPLQDKAWEPARNGGEPRAGSGGCYGCVIVGLSGNLLAESGQSPLISKSYPPGINQLLQPILALSNGYLDVP